MGHDITEELTPCLCDFLDNRWPYLATSALMSIASNFQEFDIDRFQCPREFQINPSDSFTESVVLIGTNNVTTSLSSYIMATHDTEQLGFFTGICAPGQLVLTVLCIASAVFYGDFEDLFAHLKIIPTLVDMTKTCISTGSEGFWKGVNLQAVLSWGSVMSEIIGEPTGGEESFHPHGYGVIELVNQAVPPETLFSFDHSCVPLSDCWPMPATFSAESCVLCCAGNMDSGSCWGEKLDNKSYKLTPAKCCGEDSPAAIKAAKEHARASRPKIQTVYNNEDDIVLNEFRTELQNGCPRKQLNDDELQQTIADNDINGQLKMLEWLVDNRDDLTGHQKVFKSQDMLLSTKACMFGNEWFILDGSEHDENDNIPDDESKQDFQARCFLTDNWEAESGMDLAEEHGAICGEGATVSGA